MLLGKCLFLFKGSQNQKINLKDSHVIYTKYGFYSKWICNLSCYTNLSFQWLLCFTSQTQKKKTLTMSCVYTFITPDKKHELRNYHAGTLPQAKKFDNHVSDAHASFITRWFKSVLRDVIPTSLPIFGG